MDFYQIPNNMTLPEYIQSKINSKFEWGVNDCVTFTVGWAEEITGKKYLPNKLWKDKIQALKRIKREGGIDKAFDSNFTRVEPNYARDGDICCLENTAGIISGRSVLTMEENKGFIALPRHLVKNTWRIE